MDITITGLHVAVADEVRTYIQDRVARMLHRFGREISVKVRVGLDGEQQVMEVIASAGHKHDFVAEARGENLYAMADVAVDRMDRQLGKYKAKRQDRRRRSGAEAGVQPKDAAEQEEETP